MIEIPAGYFEQGNNSIDADNGVPSPSGNSGLTGLTATLSPVGSTGRLWTRAIKIPVVTCWVGMAPEPTGYTTALFNFNLW